MRAYKFEKIHYFGKSFSKTSKIFSFLSQKYFFFFLFPMFLGKKAQDQSIFLHLFILYNIKQFFKSLIKNGLTN